ncbi:coproporphyrinogen III oxidase [Microaerobacter geothermalis]|uniref:coproporphyrinogen III oxidase n=1 Tax=Microaerobacter geothermalis TaxID=674972 RepID=UPI001F031A7B|nr:coproporphyrinogen III oxidase [Microaerobacter geothermalis]MCF6092770.1 coproporphyrinogen III oxidase [Microaerobacter geothermalis]
MKITIYCQGHRYIQEIENIISLFFERGNVTINYFFSNDNDLQMKEHLNNEDGNYGIQTENEIKIFLSIEESNRKSDDESKDGIHRIAAKAQLIWEKYVPGKWNSTHSRSVDGTQSGRELQKAEKQALHVVLVEVLEQATGERQPWGILTGIRPTKLLHRFLLDGLSEEEAHRELEENFLVKPEKIKLLQEIVDIQKKVIPDLYQLNRDVSLYIGIPFCPTKCAYCTFPAYAIHGRQGSVDTFLKSLHQEMRAIGKWLRERQIRVTTIYFGGGTPTSISASEMDELYQVMADSIPYMDQVREWTVEAGRPDTLEKDKLEVMKRWNVDRISINPQSFIQETLTTIGRHHTVEETIETFQLARSMGFNNINMDLIIGLPGEGETEFSHSLKMIEELMPESLTVHTLSFKRASAMTQNRKRYEISEQDEIRTMMEMASQWTEEHSYFPYYLYRQKNILGNLENIGYSLPGKESMYNIIIMEERQTIIGLGCGAVSKLIPPGSEKIIRWPNPKEPKVYYETYQEIIRKKIEKLNEIYLDN